MFAAINLDVFDSVKGDLTTAVPLVGAGVGAIYVLARGITFAIAWAQKAFKAGEAKKA